MTYQTRSEADTMRFAAALGRQLDAGDVLLLEGDLGAGKSVRGQRRGVGTGHCGGDAQPDVYAADPLRGRKETVSL